MRVKKSMLLALSAVLPLLALTGCNTNESGEYDRVGDVHVFDTPSRERDLPTPPVVARRESPATIIQRHEDSPRVTTAKVDRRHYVLVGDMPIE